MHISKTSPKGIHSLISYISYLISALSVPPAGWGCPGALWELGNFCDYVNKFSRQNLLRFLENTLQMKILMI